MMNENRRLAFFLPNIFTALNMACGYSAIIMAFRGEFYFACMAIALGAIFDSVDGRVARMTGTQSAFGEQFDSMSDLVSFGIAPALVFYYRFLLEAGRPGMVLAFLFMLCGALRLARFNANIDKFKSDYFQGLPIPGAACGIVGYVLISLQFSFLNDLKSAAMIYILFYSLLMISSIPFPSFKNSTWVKTHKKHVLMTIFMVLACAFLYEEIMIPVIISIYVLSSLVYVGTHREKFAGIFEWKNEADADS